MMAAANSGDTLACTGVGTPWSVGATVGAVTGLVGSGGEVGNAPGAAAVADVGIATVVRAA